MTRALNLILICLAAVLAPLALAGKPNIVFILADDMGFDSVSVNNPEGIGEMKTPHIDRLAAQGMNFTDAHSGSAVCTPTRYGLLTGRYCWRSRLKKSVLWEWGRPLIEEERVTVAEFLKQQGYRTAMVGKWHLGLHWRDEEGGFANAHIQDSDAFFRKGESARRVKQAEEAIDFSKPVTGGPLDHGFEHWFGVDVPNFPPYGWIVDRHFGLIIDRHFQAEPSEAKPEEMFGHPGPMVPGWKLEEILPTLGEKSTEVIAAEAKREGPFFLYVPLTSPHTPIAPSKEWKGRSGITNYADFILQTDAVVGRIIKAIDDAGIADNTLVVFSADNGSATWGGQIKQLREHGVNLNAHVRGHKASIWEGGHRVPLIVRWPGRVEAGSHCGDVVCLNDFYATIAAILGQPLPDKAAEDSTSILSLMKRERASLPGRPLVINHDISGNFAIRKGSWKLVLRKKPQLYDLATDPKETRNLAAEKPELVEELRKTLKHYRESGRSHPAR